jgi:hypothetical protein
VVVGQRDHVDPPAQYPRAIGRSLELSLRLTTVHSQWPFQIDQAEVAVEKIGASQWIRPGSAEMQIAGCHDVQRPRLGGGGQEQDQVDARTHGSML